MAKENGVDQTPGTVKKTVRKSKGIRPLINVDIQQLQRFLKRIISFTIDVKYLRLIAFMFTVEIVFFSPRRTY